MILMIMFITDLQIVYPIQIYYTVQASEIKIFILFNFTCGPKCILLGIRHVLITVLKHNNCHFCLFEHANTLDFYFIFF